MPGSLVGDFVVDPKEVPVLRRQALKLQVLVSRARLDQALAAGIDPGSSRALTLRAEQLLRPRFRRRLARALERLVEESDADPGWRLSAAVPFLGDEVAEARGSLLMLADALRAEPRAHPRGVAMADKLLRDPTSPLYLRTVRGELRLQVQTALECLLGEQEAWEPERWSRWPESTGGTDGLG